MANFQSWVVELVGEDLTPPFSELALETKIWINGIDQPQSIVNIESYADIENMEKAEIIASVLTAMIASKKRKDPKERPLVFNYNHPNQQKQLPKNMWKNRWQQKNTEGNFVTIDLAQKINSYYANGGLNISDDRKLDSRYENEFKFGKH